MSEVNYTEKSGIFFACSEKKLIVSEQIVPEHMLVYVYSGKLSIATADKAYCITAGHSIFFTRNHLAKFTKEPHQDLPCKSVTIFFTTKFLQQFYATRQIPAQDVKSLTSLTIAPHPLLADFFRSVSGYMDSDEGYLSEELAKLKVQEARGLLRFLNNRVDSLLADFSEPHKINLSDFMQKNFMFNIPITKFAYLTGRSLATFKRDFQKVFRNSPQKWLMERRLQHAHFLIAQKHEKPSAVYLEAGFENLSHFSKSFKQAFGYNASSVYVSL